MATPMSNSGATSGENVSTTSAPVQVQAQPASAPTSAQDTLIRNYGQGIHIYRSELTLYAEWLMLPHADIELSALRSAYNVQVNTSATHKTRVAAKINPEQDKRFRLFAETGDIIKVRLQLASFGDEMFRIMKELRTEMMEVLDVDEDECAARLAADMARRGDGSVLPGVQNPTRRSGE